MRAEVLSNYWAREREVQAGRQLGTWRPGNGVESNVPRSVWPPGGRRKLRGRGGHVAVLGRGQRSWGRVEGVELRLKAAHVCPRNHVAQVVLRLQILLPQLPRSQSL